jgi:WD40 repeat protein
LGDSFTRLDRSVDSFTWRGFLAMLRPPQKAIRPLSYQNRGADCNHAEGAHSAVHAKRATAFENTVRLWDVASGRPLRTLKGHTGAVTRVAFHASGKKLASGG